jgi:16S rRNA (guanine527-N7)-methyltransferase
LITAEEVVSAYGEFTNRRHADLQRDLEVYCDALRRWQRVQNLVSRETLTSIWGRHIADSLQLLKHLVKEDRSFLDFGSGGGLPALPLAIALKETGAHFTLVEPNARKASFLRTVGREISLPIDVLSVRIEQIDSRETIRPAVITARAVADLSALCGLAAPFFGPETRAIFHKGREYGEELEQADVHWHYDVVVIPSDTSADGVLLEIRNLRSKTAI